MKSAVKAAARRGTTPWQRLAVLLLGLCLGLSTPARAETARTPGKSAGKSPAKTAQAKGSTAKKSAAKSNAKKKSATTNRRRSGTAAGGKATQRDLARVQEEIRSAEKRIQLTREQREQKEAELRQAELEIGSLKNNVGTVQKEVSGREERLHALQAEKAQRQQDRDRLLNLIKGDLQMAQRQGGQDHYKLLLNQEDPQALARLMKYYGYMQKARAGRIHSLNETVARLEAIEREEAESMQKLLALRGELQHKQSRLNAAQSQRSQAIRLLSAQIESEEEKIQRLRRDEQALQAVMERVARESVAREQKAREQREAERRRRPAPQPSDSAGRKPPEPPPPVAEPKDFTPVPYQGRCPLPVAGGVRSKFGSARAGGLRWNGIVVAANTGTPVRAILPGRVAFADYLRGYGFLIIVDHGRGLMSLYGQNQSLQKKAGQDVAGNEVIATVGDSGGSEADGLYFEIRVRGRPSDPTGWCAYR
jgi:septal ring factor EnvC (AmiA/AmiB activator)